MTLATSMVVLNAGVVEQAGPPLELYDRPANTFVARFIGSPAMNLVEATVADDAGANVARTEEGVRLPLPPACVLPAGRTIVWGARPEHLQLAATGIAAEIASLEHTGAETHVECAVGRHRLVGVFRDRVALARGDRVFISVPAARVHVFDRQSGRRIDEPAAAG
jgi:multiple sugar transport system ATP-binding protein